MRIRKKYAYKKANKITKNKTSKNNNCSTYKMRQKKIKMCKIERYLASSYRWCQEDGTRNMYRHPNAVQQLKVQQGKASRHFCNNNPDWVSNGKQTARKYFQEDQTIKRAHRLTSVHGELANSTMLVLGCTEAPIFATKYFLE